MKCKNCGRAIYYCGLEQPGPLSCLDCLRKAPWREHNMGEDYV